MLESFLADPLYYIGVVFSLAAALAFITFLRGFLSGIVKAFTMNASDSHMDHWRVYSVWGVFLLAAIFVLWEIVRWIAGLF